MLTGEIVVEDFPRNVSDESNRSALFLDDERRRDPEADAPGGGGNDGATFILGDALTGVPELVAGPRLPTCREYRSGDSVVAVESGVPY